MYFFDNKSLCNEQKVLLTFTRIWTLGFFLKGFRAIAKIIVGMISSFPYLSKYLVISFSQLASEEENLIYGSGNFCLL